MYRVNRIGSSIEISGACTLPYHACKIYNRPLRYRAVTRTYPRPEPPPEATHPLWYPRSDTLQCTDDYSGFVLWGTLPVLLRGYWESIVVLTLIIIRNIIKILYIQWEAKASIHFAKVRLVNYWRTKMFVNYSLIYVFIINLYRYMLYIFPINF